MQISVRVTDQKEQVLKERTADARVYLDYMKKYALGDSVQVVTDKVPAYLVVQVDAGLTPALIYLTSNIWTYKIPFNLQRDYPYPDNAFLGSKHYISVRYATETEITAKQNLAVNSHDQHTSSNAFPHASANAETRNESIFFAKNAIDGMLANESHGNYPYQSWGIDQREDATLMIEFGRKVTIDGVGLVLRADYPHDSYWTEVTLKFPNGSKEVLHLRKTEDLQKFELTTRQIEWLKLTDLKKSSDSSTFPALTEIEVYGHN